MGLLRHEFQAALVLATSALAWGCGGGGGGAAGSSDGGTTESGCASQPTPAAFVPVGTSNGVRTLPGGRQLTPAGVEAPLGGFPVDVRLHPTLPIAYVMNTGYALRAVQVVDTSNGKVLQTIARPETFYGMALSAEAAHLYTAGGFAGTVDVWDVGSDGLLTAASQIAIPTPANKAANPYPAGIALSPDGTKLWVGEFLGQQIDEVDLATSTVTASVPLMDRAYSLLYVPSQNQLWVTGFGGTKLNVIDLATHELAGTVAIGPNPNGLALSKDGSRVFVSVSDADTVVAVDAATRAVVASQSVGDPEIADSKGAPLPADSPAGLLLDPDGQKLYVVRAADNAVSILDATTLAPQAAIPVGWYPTSVAIAGSKLVVLNAKGYGAGPFTAAEAASSSGKAQMDGSISLIDLASADLPALTKQVLANVERPKTLFPLQCPGFPVPTNVGDKSPSSTSCSSCARTRPTTLCSETWATRTRTATLRSLSMARRSRRTCTPSRGSSPITTTSTTTRRRPRRAISGSRLRSLTITWSARGSRTTETIRGSRRTRTRPSASLRSGPSSRTSSRTTSISRTMAR